MSPHELAKTLRLVADTLEKPGIRVDVKNFVVSTHLPLYRVCLNQLQTDAVQTGPEEVSLDLSLTIYR